MSIEALAGVESYKCATWTREHGVSPIGSAPRFDTLVLVEIPQPWPKDVGDIPAIAGVLQGAGPLVRVLAVESSGEHDPEETRFVTVWRRGPSGRFHGRDLLLPAVNLTARLIEEIEAMPTEPDSSTTAQPDVLVCGHGRRDRCCGREGVRLQLAASSRWPNARIRRCSHTGGHRFAPTGIVLPDGRCWGFLDEDVLGQVLDRTGDVTAIVPSSYRGTTALGEWAQVAERGLFERYGWEWLSATVTSATTEVAADKESATVEIAWTAPAGSGRATATVGLRRRVPVLVCGEPPENARKSSPEYALSEIAVQTG